MEWFGPVLIALIEAAKDIVKIIVTRKRRKPGIKAGRRMFDRATDREALNHVADELGVDPALLAKLIEFESGFDPNATNPRSSARGLLQFIDSTAQDLGYNDSADLVASNPTTQSQLLGPVLDYLRPMAPFENDQQLFMAVFYPSARDWPLDKEFPEQVQKANPGIKTVRDYMRKVHRIGDPTGPILFLAAICGIILYSYLLRR